MRNMPPCLLIYLKGIAMGAADVVPGVSGGTIAFISGIYERLINALANIDLNACRILYRQGLRAAWRHTDAGFLLTLLAGIASAVFSLARVLRYLLVQQPIPVWAFFFGLILGAVYCLYRHITRWSLPLCIAAFIGAGAAVMISLLPGTNTPDPGLWFLFFSGMLAICAMILPGISGAFILVLLGVYPVVLEAVHQLQWQKLAVLAAGAMLGLLLFSRLLRFLLRQYHRLSLALLTGFIAGSLVKIWPWKTATLPVAPSAVPGNPQLGLALLLMIIGLALILLLERGKRPAPTPQTPT